MDRILKAQDNATVIFDAATGEPRIIVTDAVDLSDPAWNPKGCVQVSVPIEIYNASIINPDGPHLDVLAYANEQFNILAPATVDATAVGVG